MQCSVVRDRLIRQSRPDKEIALHVETCDGCRAFAESAATAKDALAHHHLKVEPHPSFAPRVVAALPARRPVFALAALKLLPATLALAIVMSAWAFLFTPSPNELMAGIVSSELANQDTDSAEVFGISPERVIEPDLFEWALGLEDDS